MEFQALKPKVFTDLMETLKDKLQDTLLHFHPDSIKIRATDYAKTFIAYVDLNGGALDKYTCDSYQQVGVNVAKLWTVMKIAQPGDILQMTYDKEGISNMLRISIIDEKTGTTKLSTDYILYDMDEEPLEIPENISYSDCFSMKSDKFYRDLKTLENMECEFVKLRQCRGPDGKGNRLQMIGMNSSIHKNPTINTDEAPVCPVDPLFQGTSIPFGVAQPTTQRKELQEMELVFNLKLLVQFARAKCLDDKVGIHLDERKFLVLQYNVDIYGVVRFVVKSLLTEDEDGLEVEEVEENNTKKRRRDESDDENVDEEENDDLVDEEDE